MSEALGALPGARFDGIALVEEAGPIGMITIRGTLSDKGFVTVLKKQCGLAVPEQRKVVQGGGKTLIWMSPDELLLVLPYAAAEDEAASLNEALSEAHALAVNVSDARAVFDVSGGQARDVLAKLFPVDLSAEAFGMGAIRRSRMAQVPAALWLEEADRFRVVCFRSVAQYAFDVLSLAAAPGGEVGLHA